MTNQQDYANWLQNRKQEIEFHKLQLDMAANPEEKKCIMDSMAAVMAKKWVPPISNENA